LASALIRYAFPLLRSVTRRAFSITPANVEKSRQAIDQALSWLEEQIADGRQHLVGAALSAADITVCALLAPLACPSEHPVYSREDYRALMRDQTEPWSTRSGVEWVRETYRKERAFGASRVA
jgi:glutathione S-transferase